MITHTVCSAATFSRVMDPDTGVFRESDPGLDPGYLYQDPPTFLRSIPDNISMILPFICKEKSQE